MKSKIFCIGDSHASFFSGYDDILPLSPKTKNRYSIFESYRLGATLAYNMISWGTTTKGKELFYELLDLKIPKKSKIILIFGEIDCRVHIVKQAQLKNQSIMYVTKETVLRYFQFINEVKSKGYEIIVWNVVPTSCCKSLNNEYPHNGSLEERSQATLFFNKFLKEECEKAEMRFLSIYDLLVDKRGIMNKRYFIDCVHLSQKAMKFVFSELNLPFNYFYLYNYYSIIEFFKSYLTKVRYLINE